MTSPRGEAGVGKREEKANQDRQTADHKPQGSGPQGPSDPDKPDGRHTK
ncbi:hypothetical protein [Amycolatopsis arida]|nr:hypothetical protein [Amycolatopsis arida]